VVKCTTRVKAERYSLSEVLYVSLATRQSHYVDFVILWTRTFHHLVNCKQNIVAISWIYHRLSSSGFRRL